MPSVLFSATGAVQQWVAPPNLVGPITVKVWGAAGGGRTVNQKGGYVEGTLALDGGDILYLYVGRHGVFTGTSRGGAGGWPTGGDGGDTNAAGAITGGGGGGGGSSDIRLNGQTLAARIAVAAGGGGDGSSGAGGQGGATIGQGGSPVSTQGGIGGSSTGGGAGGDGIGGAAGPAPAGTLGNGGHGATTNFPNAGGGGGGGYYGGGGGGAADAAHNSGGGGGGSNYTGGLTTTTSSLRAAGTANDNGQIILTYNQLPNQPTLSAPANNLNVDVALPLTFVANFSDPDPGDTQTALDFRWRTGSGAWTTVTAVATSGASFIRPAHAFDTALNTAVEWQARTADSTGAYGPWSTSRYFTPRTAPPAPTLTLTGPTITTTTPQVLIQDAATFVQAQVQVLADSGGSPGAVLTTPQTQDLAAATGYVTVAPTFGYTNGTSYHLQVRVASPAGVWSPWTDSGALVANVNAPLPPTLVVNPQDDSASVQLTITNPAGTYPAVTCMIYRTDVNGAGVAELVGKLGIPAVPNTQTWTDWAPALNTLYDYFVTAVSVTGSATSSD